jgi:DNA replication ATP-dependent helicase Dna2
MVEKASLRGDANTSHWDFRLDKEEFTMSLISVLRSNVLRLITVPHEPNMFIAAQSSSKSGQVSGDTTKPMLSQSIVQLSSLVIDLLAPRFKTHFNHLYNSLETLIDTDIQLFLPPLNPIQLHFIQKLKSQSNASGPGKAKQSYPGSLTTATRQFYECSPPPLYVGCHPLSLLREFKLLNSGQQDVVKKVIASMDYTLLLGMPGTGKTSTLSFVIRTLVSRGDRVLITSYTNAAVDNLMNKLRESGVSTAVMGRLGHVGSLDSSMEEYAVDATNRLTSTVKDLTDRVEGYRVIGATVLTSARSGMLQKLAPFDWCVMDEAGQISQPAALGGMLLASKHLLVGDNYQLPPLVVSLEAQQQGMEVSMFKRLGEAHPNAVVSLTSQYRMNADIMSVSNCLIYENRLRCGSQVVAESRLRFRFKSQVIETLPVTQTSWLHHCLSPNNAVVFVNTDTMRNSPATKVERYDGREVEYLGPSKSEESEGNAATQSLKENKGKRSGGGALKKSALHNPTEIAVISLLVEAFACCGLENINSAIGIVSPYRSQVRSIQKSLQCLGTGLPGSGIDATTIDTLVKHSVSTVDKYQGRDMDVIVLSLVRSNDRGMVSICSCL